MRSKATDQRGFTVVELLVTMAVVGFVTAGVYATSIVQMKNTAMTNDVGKVQQNVRMATGMVERDLRFAGYGLGGGIYFNSNVGAAGQNMAALKIWNTNPDRIDLVYIQTNSQVVIDQQMPSNSAVIKVDPTGANVHKFTDGDIIIVTDGVHSDMVGVTQVNYSDAHFVHNTGGNPQLNITKKLSWAYGPGAQVFKAYRATYYIGTVNGTQCLMLDDNGPDAAGNLDGDILVPHVETMDVLAGVDLNGDDQIDSTEWKSGTYESGTDDIRSVTLAISSLSPSQDLTVSTAAETLGDQTLTSGLHYRRRVFTRVVNLRNLARR